MKDTLRDKRGFTMSELLIVVVIIAVLVAIAIPVFTTQLRNARLAVDHAAMRDAYALVQIANNAQEVELEDPATGTVRTWSFEELKSQLGNGVTNLCFYLKDDCSVLVGPATTLWPPPDGAYQFKDGYTWDEGLCEICQTWGFGVMHFKGGIISIAFNGSGALGFAY